MDYNRMDEYEGFNQSRTDMPDPVAYKLHIQLEYELMDEHEKEVLQKYGCVKESISRDIIVPAEMTLHALHYVIQRAFGWENSHLHHFEFPENVFQFLTGGTIYENDEELHISDGLFTKWAELCGIYFRFPTDDFEDIYWDDDYKEGMSFKTWLRLKYRGPYRYGGSWECYGIANSVARKFIKDNPTIRLGLPFHEWIELKEQGLLAEDNKTRIIKMEDLTINDLMGYFEGSMYELLERLPLNQLITITTPEDWDKILESISKLTNVQRSSIFEIPTVPLTNELLYKYDYGDGWRVIIKCEDVYYQRSTRDVIKKENMDGGAVLPILEKDVLADMIICDDKFERVDDELSFKITALLHKKLPICVKADGLPVMDDVGGIGGYINLLETIHGKDRKEAGNYREWARSMGWTGRMSKPDNIL